MKINIKNTHLPFYSALILGTLSLLFFIGGIITLESKTVKQAEIYSQSASSSKSPKGFLDGADCNKIAGWACDKTGYKKTIDVEIYAGNQLIATVKADKTREQGVCDSCGGNCNHGFSIQTPESLKDGGTYQITAIGVNIGQGNDTQLTNTKTLGPCGVNSSPSPSPSSAPVSPNPSGLVKVGRCYRGGANPQKDHFITTQGDCEGLEGYNWEGTLFYASISQQTGTVPLYRCYAGGQVQDHFSKTGDSCPSPYQMEDFVVYIYPNQIEGTVPLRRCYAGGQVYDHFNIPGDNSCPSPYNIEGTLGYVYTSSSPPPVLTDGTYIVKLKGPSHRQIIFCVDNQGKETTCPRGTGIDIDLDNFQFDFSNRPLEFGDIDQNGSVGVTDYSVIKSCVEANAKMGDQLYDDTCHWADANFDSVTDSTDIDLLYKTLSERPDDE